MNLVIIHISRCGGTVIRKTLKKYNIEFTTIHIQKVKFKENKKYIIVLRNPISRFISAFNWRYKTIILDKTKYKTPKTREYTILKKYNDVNNLAENIESYNDDPTMEYLHHIYEDINYYLSDFIRDCKSENILGVITQENLNEDFKKLFKIDIDINVKSKINDSSLSKTISNLGYKLLKEYLWKDYRCIKKLYNMNCLTEKQYEVLSK